MGRNKRLLYLLKIYVGNLHFENINIRKENAASLRGRPHCTISMVGCDGKLIKADNNGILTFFTFVS